MSERQRERVDSSQLDIVFGLPSRSKGIYGDAVSAKKGIQRHSLVNRSLTLTTVVVSYSCLNKLTPTKWLRTIECIVSVLKARSPKSRCWQGSSLSETNRGILSCLFLESGGLLSTFVVPWLVDSSLRSSVSTWHFPVSQEHGVFMPCHMTCLNSEF